MACPYAEKRESMIYCKAGNKLVSPLIYPCNNVKKYSSCIYYLKASAEIKRKTKKIFFASSYIVPGEVLGFDSDGNTVDNCLDCVFYMRRLAVCSLLNVNIFSPEDPACKEIAKIISGGE